MNVLVLLLALNSLPQFQSGTIVALEFSEERLIIAADSRLTDDNGKPLNDCACKISVIDKSLIFAGTGKQHLTYNGRTFIDGTDVAVRVRRNNKSASVKRIATLWAEQMKITLGEVGKSSREALLKNLSTEIIVRGIFGGVEADGRIAVYNTAVIYKLSGGSVILSTKFQSLGHDMEVFGHDDLFQEFFNMKTKRGIDWNMRLDKELDAKHIGDREPYRLIAGLEATIQWANDSFIGGDVDELILNKGGKMTWVKRKTNCAEAEQHHGH